MPNATRNNLKIDIKLAPRKSEVVNLRFEQAHDDLIREKMKKFEVKSFQQLFDFLIVSGFVWRNRDFIDYVRDNLEKEKNDYIENRLGQFQGANKDYQRLKKPKLRPIKMYPEENLSFKECLVELDAKQQWIYRILLYWAFAVREEKFIIEFINICKEKKVNERKKSIERISNDIPIQRIPKNEAQHLLKQFTNQYDNGEIGKLGEKIRYSLFQKSFEDEEVENKEVERQLREKIKKLNKMKNQKIDEIVGKTID